MSLLLSNSSQSGLLSVDDIRNAARALVSSSRLSLDFLADPKPEEDLAPLRLDFDQPEYIEPPDEAPTTAAPGLAEYPSLRDLETSNALSRVNHNFNI